MLSVILHSGEWDKIYHGFNIASLNASLGEETLVFLTYWALKNVCKGEKFSSEGHKEIIEEGRKRGIVKELEHVIKLGKSFGLKIVACSTSVELLGLKKLPEWIDEVGGLLNAINADRIIFI
ncbi:MAG: hypothetical protein QXN34_07615 [Archaeoglobaceae archaeon]